MGAWIETKSTNANFAKGLSHPVWVRGLKLFADSITLVPQ